MDGVNVSDLMKGRGGGKVEETAAEEEAVVEEGNLLFTLSNRI